MLTFIYHLDADEHLRAVRLWMSHRRVPGWLKAAPWVLGAAALALAAWVAASPAAKRGELLWDWGPLLAVVWLAVWFFRRMLTGRVWRGLMDELAHVDEPVTFSISDESVGVRSKTERSDETWNQIRQVVETPEFFLFIVSDDCAHYLPRHAITSQADLDALRGLIHAQLGERAELLDSPLDRPAAPIHA
jgi:YcxB-like protein